MAILPYCVVEENARVKSPATGVSDAPIMELSEGGMRCYYSELDAVPKDVPTIRTMALQFQNVISEVFAQAVTIPFRFVTLLKTEDELRDFLEDNSERFVTALERLEGTAQFELRLVKKNQEKVKDEPESGYEYLRARKAASDVFKKTSEALRASAGDLVMSWRLKVSDDEAKSFALVERDKAQKFKEALAGAKLKGDLRVVVSGPWPPTEFIE
jgi:hypothetical protein